MIKVRASSLRTNMICGNKTVWGKGFLVWFGRKDELLLEEN